MFKFKHTLEHNPQYEEQEKSCNATSNTMQLTEEELIKMHISTRDIMQLLMSSNPEALFDKQVEVLNKKLDLKPKDPGIVDRFKSRKRLGDLYRNGQEKAGIPRS